MEAQGNISPEVYRRASLATFRYFYIGYSWGKSVLSTLKANDEFGTALKILEEGKTKYANHQESIVNPLKEAGFLICDDRSGYCKVTDEGREALIKFESGANGLDKTLRDISSLGMEAFDKRYVISKGVERLREFISSHGPFIPTGYTDPFVEAFARANGEPGSFILQIGSFYHIFAFLLAAEYIAEQETRYEAYAFTCNGEKKIKEILTREGRYPTGKGIKVILEEDYVKRYNIPGPESPLQAFSTSGLIENLKYGASCACGVTRRYTDDRYRLTKHGENLAKYIAIHPLFL